MELTNVHSPAPVAAAGGVGANDAPAGNENAPPVTTPRVACPRRKCTGFLGGEANAGVCDNCGKTSKFFSFLPVPELRLPLLPAGDGDAACAHHPQRKAQTICMATGDYICPLCTVEIAGKPFSAQYLGSAAGQALAENSTARRLPRPDSLIVTWLVSMVVPPVCYIAWYATIFMAPLSVFLYFKTRRLRRENALAREVIGRGRMLLIPIILTIVGCLVMFFIAAVALVMLATGTGQI